jgi:hypothetical protein
LHSDGRTSSTLFLSCLKNKLTSALRHKFVSRDHESHCLPRDTILDYIDDNMVIEHSKEELASITGLLGRCINDRK